VGGAERAPGGVGCAQALERLGQRRPVPGATVVQMAELFEDAPDLGRFLLPVP
jgi:hypothetical protein